MELRKQKEKEFANLVRDKSGVDSRGNVKFYSIIRSSQMFMEKWLRARAGAGKRLLDFACGDGAYSILSSKMGFEVTGIDISDVSINNANEMALQEDIKNIRFLVADCEATEFPDEYFDVILVAGVLHHLDLEKAFAEMVRILRPDGEIICVEGIADNPLINYYRRKTPTYRTEWEIDHILRVRDLKIARQYFERVEYRFYHLFTVAAVPFRGTWIFEGLLAVLEALDSLVLRVPLVRTQAWQMIFLLSHPNKALLKQSSSTLR